MGNKTITSRLITTIAFLLSSPSSRSSLGDRVPGKDAPGRPIRVNLGRTRGDEDIWNALGLLIVASESKWKITLQSSYNSVQKMSQYFWGVFFFTLAIDYLNMIIIWWNHIFRCQVCGTFIFMDWRKFNFKKFMTLWIISFPGWMSIQMANNREK